MPDLLVPDEFIDIWNFATSKFVYQVINPHKRSMEAYWRWHKFQCIVSG